MRGFRRHWAEDKGAAHTRDSKEVGAWNTASRHFATNMVVVHNVFESGRGAVEVLAEESCAASRAAEAFRWVSLLG